MALKLLLTFFGEREIDNIKLFGDFMVVLNWIRKSEVCHNIRLVPLLDEVLTILNSYSQFSVCYIYREYNKMADKLSKEGTQLVPGQWKIKEHKDGFCFRGLSQTVYKLSRSCWNLDFIFSFWTIECDCFGHMIEFSFFCTKLNYILEW